MTPADIEKAAREALEAVAYREFGNGLPVLTDEEEAALLALADSHAEMLAENARLRRDYGEACDAIEDAVAG